ncbi:MAG TPA: fibronectin type III domain-containing protein [Nitrospirae bacterium]|nr:hypothetical protein BMS3Abin06_02451 [bacterium BMS3Abin06]HDH10859.1 fibronectin type III domain-containing protein [Nitrospirota bacterium]HDZ02276.1 fibronectin type III domain-containing protein [Nitrospirota bacterium]
MINGKYKKRGKGAHTSSGLFLLVTYLLFLVFITACGRRGDPVAILSYDENIIKEEIAKESEKGKGQDEVLIKENEPEAKAIETARPDAPSGLVAVYTQTSIVLTWDEVLKQGVKSYKIYRSSGSGYKLAGVTVTPAFTDRGIKQDMKYYYKVTAVGNSESLPSGEIRVIKEVD